MNLFAEVNELEFNGQILSQHPGYLRKASVNSRIITLRLLSVDVT